MTRASSAVGGGGADGPSVLLGKSMARTWSSKGGSRDGGKSRVERVLYRNLNKETHVVSRSLRKTNTHMLMVSARETTMSESVRHQALPDLPRGGYSVAAARDSNGQAVQMAARQPKGCCWHSPRFRPHNRRSASLKGPQFALTAPKIVHHLDPDCSGAPPVHVIRCHAPARSAQISATSLTGSHNDQSCASELHAVVLESMCSADWWSYCLLRKRWLCEAGPLKVSRR